MAPGSSAHKEPRLQTVKRMDRNTLVGALTVVVVAYAASVAIKSRPSDAAPSAADVVAQSKLTISTQRVVSTLPEQARALATEDSTEAALVAHVEHKYRFLVAEMDQEHVDDLKRRLLERESEANLVARNRMDEDLGRILPADSVAHYQRLKDSDREQHQLAEFTGGISNIAPLDDRQERTVLDAKLRQKQRYASAMHDLGLERDALSVEERDYAHKRTAEALKQYMQDLLTEVGPSLTAEQYAQLKNYETTEFERELIRLQQKINAK